MIYAKHHICKLHQFLYQWFFTVCADIHTEWHTDTRTDSTDTIPKFAQHS